MTTKRNMAQRVSNFYESTQQSIKTGVKVAAVATGVALGSLFYNTPVHAQETTQSTFAQYPSDPALGLGGIVETGRSADGKGIYTGYISPELQKRIGPTDKVFLEFVDKQGKGHRLRTTRNGHYFTVTISDGLYDHFVDNNVKFRGIAPDNTQRSKYGSRTDPIRSSVYFFAPVDYGKKLQQQIKGLQKRLDDYQNLSQKADSLSLNIIKKLQKRLNRLQNEYNFLQDSIAQTEEPASQPQIKQNGLELGVAMSTHKQGVGLEGSIGYGNGTFGIGIFGGTQGGEYIEEVARKPIDLGNGRVNERTDFSTVTTTGVAGVYVDVPIGGPFFIPVEGGITGEKSTEKSSLINIVKKDVVIDSKTITPAHPNSKRSVHVQGAAGFGVKFKNGIKGAILGGKDKRGYNIKGRFSITL